MDERKALVSFFDTAVLAIVVILASLCFDTIPIRILFCCCLLAAIIEICSIRLRKRPATTYFDLSLLEIGILIIAIIFSADAKISGPEWIYIIGITVASDAGGLAFGKIIGWRKVEFLAKISPNKSYAGYLGEFICSWVAGIAIILIFGVELSTANSIFLVTAWFSAACGDLMGSACKRFLGVKDSGEVLKNVACVGVIELFVRSRKGYLDCFDSISFNLIYFVAIQFIMRSLT